MFEIAEYESWLQPDVTIDVLFKKVVSRAPTAVAIVDHNVTLTYTQVDELSDSLAAALLKRGLEPGSVIGIYLQKSWQYLIGCLATFKVQSAYLHIDSAYSADLIEQVLLECQPAMVLTSSSMPLLTYLDGVDTLMLDSDESWRLCEGKVSRVEQQMASAVAIVGYTSGTTGTPKGVAISHRAAIYSYCKFWEEIKDSPERDRLGYVTYMAWDAMSPLLFGATGIIVPDEANHDHSLLLDSFAKFSINHAFMTPSLLATLLREFDENVIRQAFKFLRVLWVGGEVVTRDLISLVANTLPEVTLVNNYGPTECFVVSQGKVGLQDVQDSAVAPAGQILPEIEYVLLDEDCKDVTDKGIGQLFVSGPPLAEGYIGRPNLDAQRFIRLNGRTFYRTNDLCLVDGNRRLSVIGRQDSEHSEDNTQLEFLEKSELIREQAGLEECVILGLQNRNGKLERVIFCVDSAASDRDFSDLDDVVRGVFETEREPYRIVVIEEMPLNPASQKLDYFRLLSISQASEKGLEAPI